MSYILDTCVISELIKKSPDKNVLKWYNNCDEEQLLISSLSLGEINYGVQILTNGKKKNDLIVWFNDLQKSFKDSILCITDNICLRWGLERANLQKKGIILPVIDGLIACTSLEYNHILVSRDTQIINNLNIQILNPWI